MRAWLVAISLMLAVGTARAGDDKYPMPTSAYRKHVDKKLKKHRKHLENRMRERAVSTSKRERARKAYDALEIDVRKLLSEYGADHTITKQESRAIKARGKRGRHAIYRELGIKFGKGD